MWRDGEMQIGRRIYWDKLTGNRIVDTGERSGDVIETTVEQDLASYRELAERMPETVGMIQLEYKQYEQDFDECNGYRVDPATEEILFSYPDPAAPEEPPVYQKPLTEQLAEIKADKEKLKNQVAQMNNDFVGFQSFIFEKFPDLA